MIHQTVILSKLFPQSWKGYLGGLAYFGTNSVRLFVLKIHYFIFDKRHDIFIRQCLRRRFERLMLFAKTSVTIWVNCLDNILIILFVLFVNLVTFCLFLPVYLFIKFRNLTLKRKITPSVILQSPIKSEKLKLKITR